MYKGKSFVVFCSELALDRQDWTKDDSMEAANQWWRKKEGELRKTHPHEPIAAPLRKRIEYAQTHGLTDEIAANESLLAEVLTVSEIPDGLRFRIHEHDDVWADRFSRPTPATKKVPTLAKALDDWLALIRVNAKPSSVVMVAGYVKLFQSLTLNEQPVLTGRMLTSVIDETKVEDVHRSLDAMDTANPTKRKQFIHFKSFVKYCYTRRYCERPLNLDDRRLTWKVDKTQKPELDVKAVLEFLNTLPDRLKLYALLAFNCGANNIDIASLKRDQFDLKVGTLIRKRVKTESWESVPLVKYKLWKPTVALLKQQMATSGELALLDRAGQPLYIASKEGHGTVYDKIKSTWRDTLGRSSERPYTLKDFRTFGSMLLQNSPYRSYRDPWLGHATEKVSEEHYSGTEDVCQACEWMEREIWPKN
jgi:integrase